MTFCEIECSGVKWFLVFIKNDNTNQRQFFSGFKSKQ